MKKIQMVDLNGQYLKIKTEINTAIQSVIDSSSFIKGAVVGELERSLANYLNVKHVICCGNGTDALQLALMSLDIQPDDEIITSDFTFAATAEVAALLGAKLVLVDVDSQTFTINIDEVKRKTTNRTKAIVPVHLFGQAANMQQLMMFANERQIAVIEDTAQAFGAEYTFENGSTCKLGTIGTIGCTSFFPSKNLGCFGDGGAIFTNNDELARLIRMYANHGVEKKYYHQLIGINSRLDSIQAAILLEKLKHIDQYNKARQSAAEKYDIAFADCPQIKIPSRQEHSSHVFHQYTLTLTQGSNTDLQAFLKAKDIPSMIYYPFAIHALPAFAKYVGANDNFDVSEHLSHSVISLPMHTELDDEQIEYIANTIKSYFK